jgi:hypothetical protein
MDHEKQYESWKQKRADAELPADFADRVMASIRGRQELARRVVLASLLAAARRSRAVRAGVCLAGIAVGIAKIAIVLSIFLS